MYNTWKQMIQFSDERVCSIEEIPVVLNMILPEIRKGLLPNQAKKMESINIPKTLCVYS
jgi:hypothetical protein